MNGAEGVGGLLAVNNTTENYYTMYDGNGNIVQYLDETQTSVAKFEYTPFGQLKSETGSMPEEFNYRFSTKYHDTSTGLTVYRYRNYNPTHGKWQTRDPIGEKGGYNLYGFVTNNPISKWDYLGKNAQDLVLKMLGYKLRKAVGVTLLDISIVVVVEGITLGIQTVFFPDSCEIGIYAYGPAIVGESLNPTDDDPIKDPENHWERISKIIKYTARDMSIGLDLSIGISGQLAFYKGKGDANADSWLKRFDGFTIGGSAIAKAGGGLYWSDDWAGVSIGVGVSATPVINFKTTPQWYWELKFIDLKQSEATKCLCYALTASMP